MPSVAALRPGRPELRSVRAVARGRSAAGPSDSATCSATSATTPNRSRRPPKAMLQSVNHAQPSASPPITSVSQWTSSSTRLEATATAIPTAPPASTARAARGRRRPSRSAHGRVERCGGRRVAARERRAERGRCRVEGGSRPVDDVLDHGRDELLAGDDRDDERHDPPTACPVELDGGKHDREHDHDVDRSELGDAVQHVVRERRGLAVPPLRDAVVDRGQARVRPHEVREQPEHDAGDGDQDEGDREARAR